MIDQNSQFMAILTAVGEAKQANADALCVPWTFAQMGVGDAGGADPLPNRAQTKLINERRRAPLNQVMIDPKNNNVIIAEQVIPENVGGWWIREIGLYDADGDLVAVANCAPSFKPLLAQGSGKTQVVRMNFIVTSATNVVLKIDPSVVLATRQYVDEHIIEVLPPIRKAGTYQKVTINERGIVVEGSNPGTLAENGITDAYTKTQTNEALALKAPLDSPALTGVPTGPTAVIDSNSLQLANTAYVQAAIHAVIAGAPGALDTLKELADALGGDPNFSNTIINALAGCLKAEGSASSAGFAMGDMNVPYMRWANTPVYLATQKQLNQKADKGVTLQDYNIAGGKFTHPVDVNMTGQGVGAAGLKITNETLGLSAVNLTLVGVNTGVQVIHFNGEQGLYVLEVNSNKLATINAGDIRSNGSKCHTEADFLRPRPETWVPIIKGTALPAGGTWAWFLSNFYDSGRPLDGSTGISAGGTVPANGLSVGFAWRIQ